jgi:hypothetical protein
MGNLATVFGCDVARHRRNSPMKKLPRAVVAAALSMLCVAECSESPSPPDVQFLASDTHFSVGGQHIVIPAVAIRGPDHTFDLGRRRPEKSLKERLKLEASDPSNPMKTDKLDLLIRQYQYTGAHPASENICPLLTRKWSQSLCRGQHRGLLRRLPEKFDFLDRLKLDLLRNHWTVGKERKYDQVKNMAIQPGLTEIGCDRESRFCTAMVEVLPGLLAVWTVWSGGTTGVTAEEMAHTQGVAIVQFVRRALGPAEDPTLVNAD